MATGAAREALTQAVTLVPVAGKYAGTGAGLYTGDFGSASFVALNAPSSVAFDSSGNLYIADTANNCVRRVDATSGSTTTLVGLVVSGSGDTCNTASNATPTAAQGLYLPSALAIDATDNLYIADTGHNCVRLLPAHTSGTASTQVLTGTCTAPNSGSTVTAGSSTPQPVALTLDASRSLYISLRNAADSTAQVVRQANGAGANSLCRVAGAATSAVPTNCAGIANSVTLNEPGGIAFDPSGNIYIADSSNNCIRVVNTAGTISTAVGTCTNDGTTGGSAAIVNPRGLLVNKQGELYFTEESQNLLLSFSPGTKAIRRIAGDPSGAAGSYTALQNGTGSQSVPLAAPKGMVLDTAGNLYLADSQNHIIRRFQLTTSFGNTPLGSGSTSQLIIFSINNALVNLATSTGPDYTVDATNCSGPLAGAPANSLSNFCTVTVSFHPTLPGPRNSSLRITDSTTGTSVWTGLQGTSISSQPVYVPGKVQTSAASIPNPVSLTVDAAGNTYVLNAGATPGSADLRILPAGGGAATTVTLSPAAALVTPSAITSDPAGNLYLADSTTGKVVKFAPDGTPSPNYVTGLTSPTALALDSYGNLFIAEGGVKHDVVESYVGGEVVVLAGAGSNPAANNAPATTSLLVSPSGLAVGPNGTLYISDGGAHRVYSVDSAGIMHLLAGTGGTTSTNPDTSLGTALLQPGNLAVDAAGDVFVVDSQAHLVYVVYSSTSQTQNINILLGTGIAGSTGDGGIATEATVNRPAAVATTSDGTIYVADSTAGNVRAVSFPSPIVDFGNIGTGGQVLRSQNLWNRGNTEFIRTTDHVISNAAITNYAPLTTCGQSVLLGSTCAFGFAFNPTTGGSVSATGNLFDVAYNSPQAVNFIGTAIAPVTSSFTAPATTLVYGALFRFAVDLEVSGTAATGTITFSVGATTYCTLPGTVSGPRVCTNAAAPHLPAGPYSVKIVYSGDSNYPTDTIFAALTVTPAPLSVVVDSKTKDINTPNPTLTGTVTGVVTGDSATATYSTTAALNSPAGAYPITAAVAFGPGTLAANYTVNVTNAQLNIVIPTTVTLVSSNNPSVFSSSVTFTTTVAATQGTPDGAVGFYDGTTLLQSVPVAGGVAVYSTSALSPGSHNITATYTPLTTTFAGGSAALVQNVSVATGGFSITVSPNTQLIFGAGSNTFSVHVSATGTFSGTVSLACSGLPTDATCVLQNAVLNLPLNGSADTTFTTTVTLADANMAMLQNPSLRGMDVSPIVSATVFPFGMLGLFALGAGRRRKPGTHGNRRLLLLVLGLGLIGLAGCGCPSSGFTTYPITITGTSGAAAPATGTTSLTVAVPRG
jgi:sugar lactone lactonase YvrE